MLPGDESADIPSRAEIYGLATLAGHAGTRRDLRIKAMRALARIPDQNAIRVLGEMALFEEDAELRAEAVHSLEETFGEDLPKVLEGIRQELTGNWGQSSPDEEEGEEEPARLELPQSVIAPSSAYQSPREEGTPLWLLWAVIGLVVLGGLIYLFLLR